MIPTPHYVASLRGLLWPTTLAVLIACSTSPNESGFGPGGTTGSNASGIVLGDGSSSATGAEGGSFAVPRAAIDALTGDAEPRSMTVVLERQRSVLHKGFSTKGSLLEQEIRRAGWIELVSRSAQTATIVGCNPGFKACGDGCIDTTYDELNCGDCDNVCATGEICNLGVCE